MGEGVMRHSQSQSVPSSSIMRSHGERTMKEFFEVPERRSRGVGGFMVL
jgi:hypothetical protein